MRAVDIIRAKRDGQALTREAIDSFVRGVTDGGWPDYQATALLMAIVLKGMGAQETADLRWRTYEELATRDAHEFPPGPKERA